jgi:osmoprotectant transport system ATP-binding protein
VFVTHDVDEAVLLGDRIAIMQQHAHVAQYGPPAELLARPASEFVASFIGGTRGLKLLSLRPASDVPVTEVDGSGVGGWTLRVDESGRPTVWASLNGGGPDTPVEPVGPKGSLRDLLDSAVTAPPRAAVRVDGEGKLVGTVPLAVIEAHLPAPEAVATEAQGAG